MGSSPGFGSTPCDSIALFGLAFAAAPRRLDLLASPHRSNSSAHSSIGTPSSLRRRTPTACRPTVSGLFHSPLGVLFTFPSRYLCTIGRQGYLALEGGPPSFPQDFSCPVVLTYVPRACTPFVYGAITLYGSPFQVLSTRGQVGNSVQLLRLLLVRRTTPLWHRLPGHSVIEVWALPRSLTTTWGISVDFFSSGYLDVSVPLVTFLSLCVQLRMRRFLRRRFPDSGIPG